MKFLLATLFILVGVLPVVRSAAILESSALMDWVWQPEQANPVPLSVPAVYQLETETGAFFTDLFHQTAQDAANLASLNGNSNGNNGSNNNGGVAVVNDTDDIVASLLVEQIVLSVTLQVRQQLERNGRQVLETIVTCQYLSESGIPADLPAVLIQIVNRNQLPNKDAAGALQDMLYSAGTNAISAVGASTLSFSFRRFDDSKILETVAAIEEEIDEDGGRTNVDRTLIVAVGILAGMVIVVSSVLLYITGGWSLCRVCVNNCLFEEVDVEYDVPQKSTYNPEDFENEGGEDVYSDEGEGYDDDDDDGSIETGLATNPSGILGVHSQDENADPMAGLGIKTPSRNMYGDNNHNNIDMTPMSAMTPNDTDAPLGIMSMRKLPQPETPEGQVQGGLAHMIMARVAKATAYSNTLTPLKN